MATNITNILFLSIVLLLTVDLNVKAAPITGAGIDGTPIYYFCKTKNCFVFLQKRSGSDILLQLSASDQHGAEYAKLAHSLLNKIVREIFTKEAGKDLFRYRCILPLLRETVFATAYNNLESYPLLESQKKYDIPLSLESHSDFKGIEMNYNPDSGRLSMIYTVNTNGENSRTYGFLSFKVRSTKVGPERTIQWELPEKPKSLSSTGKISVVASEKKVWLLNRKEMTELDFPENETRLRRIKKVIIDKNNDIYVIAKLTDGTTVYHNSFSNERNEHGSHFEKFTIPGNSDSSENFIDLAIAGNTLYLISKRQSGFFVLGIDTHTQMLKNGMEVNTHGNYRSLSVVDDRLFVLTDGFFDGDRRYEVLEIEFNSIKNNWNGAQGSSNENHIARITEANENKLTMLITRTSDKRCKADTLIGSLYPGYTVLNKYELRL